MRVLDRLGLGQSFEAIHDIHACGYAPKPTPSAYHGMIDRFGIDPARSLFVEDMARNLKPARALGMPTVWINNGSERGADEADPALLEHRKRLVWVKRVAGRVNTRGRLHRQKKKEHKNSSTER